MSEFSVEKMNDKTMVYIHGNLDTSDRVEELKCIMNQLFDDGKKEIILNMEDTHTVNIHCISNIMIFYRILKDIGGCLYVTPPKGKVKSLFKTLKLDKILPEYAG